MHVYDPINDFKHPKWDEKVYPQNVMESIYGDRTLFDGADRPIESYNPYERDLITNNSRWDINY